MADDDLNRLFEEFRNRPSRATARTIIAARLETSNTSRSSEAGTDATAGSPEIRELQERFTDRIENLPADPKELASRVARRFFELVREQSHRSERFDDAIKVAESLRVTIQLRIERR